MHCQVYSYGEFLGLDGLEGVPRKLLLGVRFLINSLSRYSFIFQLCLEANNSGELKIRVPSNDFEFVCLGSFSWKKRNCLVFSGGDGFIVLVQGNAFVIEVFSYNNRFSVSRDPNKSVAKDSSFLRAVQKNIGIAAMQFPARFKGFVNGYDRPYHYFYDRMPLLIDIAKSSAVLIVWSLKNKAFLRISDLIEADGIEEFDCEEFPSSSIGGFYLETGGPIGAEREALIKRFSLSFLSNYGDAISEVGQRQCLSYDYAGRRKIWLGCCSETRAWIEQEQAYKSIIESVLEKDPDCIFFLDGMTSTLSNDSRGWDVNPLIESLSNKFPGNCISLNGVSTAIKIILAGQIFAFASSAKSDSLWASFFNHKAGLCWHGPDAKIGRHVHYNTTFIEASKLAPSNYAYLGKKKEFLSICPVVFHDKFMELFGDEFL